MSVGPVNRTPRSITLVALLFVARGRKAQFERFESAAAAVMIRHGGKIERRVRFRPRDDSSQPDELHVVTFPDRASFDRYRDDPDIRALAGLRAEAIRRTVVWQGVDSSPPSVTSTRNSGNKDTGR